MTHGTVTVVGPTSSPSPLHIVMDGTSPVWLQPLLTGAFVLAAAIITAGIAFLSLRASDKRKLAREDKRQWDREVREVYSMVAAETRRLLAHMESASHSLAYKRSHGTRFSPVTAVRLRIAVGRYNRALAAARAQLELFRVPKSHRALHDMQWSALNLLDVPSLLRVMGPFEDEADYDWVRDETKRVESHLDSLTRELRAELRL
ncbi:MULTISPECIES: hypothetical protein [unclassified Curtobacterium]|uniref:hypothetical protein n=1 Tax=unclassified Curtobacterium TaxID=257496 RepID=UPI0039AEA5BA